MKNYIYNTNIGTLEIRQTEYKNYELWLDDELLGNYETPDLAAADVANFDTDYVEWDSLENEIENVPADLFDWTIVEEETPQE